MDFHEAYTIRMFYNGQKEFQEDEFFAASETVAYNYAADVAKAAGASHFNVSKGKIDREEAPVISRKRS
jgi:hypothetical protein